MSESIEGPVKADETFKGRVRELLRTSILDAAWQRASQSPWSQVRIADIADDVGVSRQTIYNEFGTKEQLSLALFNRELESFLNELERQLNSKDQFQAALRHGLTWMLRETIEHKLLSRMVRDAQGGASDGLIPILTVKANHIIRPVRTRMSSFVLERWPDADEAAVTVAVDLCVRFVIGQAITPTDLDHDAVVDAMVGMAMNVQSPARSR